MDFTPFVPLLSVVASGIFALTAAYKMNQASALEKNVNAAMSAMNASNERERREAKEEREKYQEDREGWLAEKKTLMGQIIEYARNVKYLDEQVKALWLIIDDDRRLFILMEFIPYPLVLVNGGGRIVKANKQFSALAGYSKQGILQHNIREIIKNFDDLLGMEHERSFRCGLTICTSKNAEIEAGGKFIAFRDGEGENGRSLQYIFVKHPVEDEAY